jgi:signal transduction histidine kinase
MSVRRYADAIKASEKSIAISMQYGYRDKTKESYGILYEIYEHLGDHQKALSNYRIFNLYQDSIFSEDRIQYIENLRINFETERMQHDNELLRKDAELKDARIAEQKSYTLIAVILTLSLTGAIIFLYYSYRQNKQRTRLLSDYNTNLEKQVERRTQELVKSNLELIRQNNQLEQFAFITAHNLRAPVARMLGLAEVVNLDTFDPKTDKALVESFRTTAEQLDGIIHDMNAILDVKKNTQANYEVVDFDERIRRIRNLLREPIESTHATVETDFTRVKSCFAIPAYIESILYNLLSNAIKYRSPDREPRVTIRTAIQENQLELTVQDNGIGMDLSRVKEKLFNLYQRFHLDIEGRGMGLFLVKTQVEAMNGSIQVTSAVNQGTTFRITFPLQMTSHVPG